MNRIVSILMMDRFICAIDDRVVSRWNGFPPSSSNSVARTIRVIDGTVLEVNVLVIVVIPIGVATTTTTITTATRITADQRHSCSGYNWKLPHGYTNHDD